MADAVAGGTLPAQVCDYADEPYAGRGCAWQTYASDEDPPAPWDVDSLGQHVKQLVRQSHEQQMWSAVGAATDKGTTLRYIKALFETGDGILPDVSFAVWDSPRVDQRMVQNVVKVLANRVYTERIRRRNHSDTTPASLCRRCDMNAEDTVHHRLNRNTWGEKVRIMQRRHAAALGKVADALGNGALRDRIMFQEKCRLPEWVLPSEERTRTSIPDLIMFPSMGAGYWTPRRLEGMSDSQRRGQEVILFELKYTLDTRVHSKVADAIAQHEALAAELRDWGWGRVSILPFIIGNMGVMRTANLTALKEAGVAEQDAIALLRDLHVDSIEHSNRLVDLDKSAYARNQAPSPRKRRRDGDDDDAKPRPSSRLPSSPDGAEAPTSPAQAGRRCSSSTPLGGASHTASASTAVLPTAPLGGAGSADAGPTDDDSTQDSVSLQSQHCFCAEGHCSDDDASMVVPPMSATQPYFASAAGSAGRSAHLPALATSDRRPRRLITPYLRLQFTPASSPRRSARQRRPAPQDPMFDYSSPAPSPVRRRSLNLSSSPGSPLLVSPTAPSAIPEGMQSPPGAPDFVPDRGPPDADAQC